MNKEEKKILLIDDSDVIHLLIEKILQTINIELNFEHAYDGINGVKKYKIFSPDLTFLDISMPMMSGYGCLKRIMKFDSEAKVIMLTALDQKEVSNKIKEIGAIGFISKPFKPDDLINKAKSVLYA
jgi:two-component system, chemotaxis family, chemotaxis protein CheY